jgi:hypothetical protein
MERIKVEKEALKQKEAARVKTGKDLEKQLRKLQLERDNDKHRLQEQEENKEEEQQMQKRPSVEAAKKESSRIKSRRKTACMKLAALKNKTADLHPHSSATFSPTQSLRRVKKSFGMPRTENANIIESNNEHQESCYGIGESIVSKPISPSPGLTKSKEGSMKSPLHRRKARYADTQLLDRQGAGILPLPCSTTTGTSARTSTTTTPRSLLLQKQQSDSALLLGRGSTTTGVRRKLLFGNNKSSRNGAGENREYLSLNEPGEDQQEQNEDEDEDADADEAAQKDNTTNCKGNRIKSGGLRAKKDQTRSGQDSQDQEQDQLLLSSQNSKMCHSDSYYHVDYSWGRTSMNSHIQSADGRLEGHGTPDELQCLLSAHHEESPSAILWDPIFDDSIMAGQQDELPSHGSSIISAARPPTQLGQGMRNRIRNKHHHHQGERRN